MGTEVALSRNRQKNYMYISVLVLQRRGRDYAIFDTCPSGSIRGCIKLLLLNRDLSGLVVFQREHLCVDGVNEGWGKRK